jgi:hypothetical protein
MPAVACRPSGTRPSCRARAEVTPHFARRSARRCARGLRSSEGAVPALCPGNCLNEYRTPRAAFFTQPWRAFHSLTYALTRHTTRLYSKAQEARKHTRAAYSLVSLAPAYLTRHHMLILLSALEDLPCYAFSFASRGADRCAGAFSLVRQAG